MPAIETEAPKKVRLGATTLSEAQLRRLITQLIGPNKSTTNAAGGRFAELYRRIQKREEHFYNLKAADPVLPEPHNATAAKFQSDKPRELWVQLKARLTENQPVITARAGNEKNKAQAVADKAERILQLGFENAQQREGIDLLGALADGQIIPVYGVLHWEKAADIWPGMPEDEDDAPDAETKVADRYQAALDADNRKKAQAGFPWFFEVYHANQCAFIPDRSMANGFGTFLTVRRVPYIDYAAEQEQDGLYLRPGLGRGNQGRFTKSLRVYEERPRPDVGAPSDDPEAWGREVLVAQVWFRGEWYELVNSESSPTSGGWQLVKSDKHPYGMPPFALCLANETNSNDPALRYTPALEGVYRIKPYVDYYRTLLFAIAQQIALPLYYLIDEKGQMGLDSAGKPLVLTRDALAAQQLPPGYKLETVKFELNPAFVAAMESLMVEYQESFPKTGNTEITGTTQPWTARIGMSQANVEPARLVQNIASTLATCFQNIAYVNSLTAEEGGFGRAIPMLDGDEVLTVEPEEWKGIKVDVTIQPQSAAERITIEEHGRALLDDPNVPLTRSSFVEDYMGRSDASDILAAWDSERMYEEYLRPGVVKQELARIFSEFVVLGANGQAVGMDGNVVDPAQYLQQQGWQVPPPPQPPMPSMPPQPPMAPQAPGGAQMPSMPGLAVPNTVGLPGQVG